jgi:hypothetical protein
MKLDGFDGPWSDTQAELFVSFEFLNCSPYSRQQNTLRWALLSGPRLNTSKLDQAVGIAGGIGENLY